MSDVRRQAGALLLFLAGWVPAAGADGVLSGTVKDAVTGAPLPGVGVWVWDCRGAPVANIEQGYISSASSILANLSMQLGRTLKWDPATGQVMGDAEANQLLRRPYRAPWVHPDPANVWACVKTSGQLQTL